MLDTIVPFHPGEIEAQTRAGFVMHSAPIRPFLTDQHRNFFAQLPIVFATLADPVGWPVATALTGAPGFLSSLEEHLLRVAAQPGSADPARAGLQNGAAIGLLGLDPVTRRRSRLNGTIKAVTEGGFAVSVRQSFGNCPQYIQSRHIVASQGNGGSAVERLDGLDDEGRRLIGEADTFFVASTDGARGGEAGGLDMSHRGGRPGFVRVAGDVLTIPDFRGNRYFNTLGNLMLDGRVGLLFVDWARGGILQLQGRAEIIWEGEEVAGITGAERLWRVKIVAGWRRPGVLPFRWKFDDYAATTERTGVWQPGASQHVTTGS